MEGSELGMVWEEEEGDQREGKGGAEVFLLLIVGSTSSEIILVRSQRNIL